MTAAVFLDQYYIMSFCAVRESCVKLLDLLLWKCTAETKNGLIQSALVVVYENGKGWMSEVSV